MSNAAEYPAGSYEGEFFKVLKYIPVSPWAHPVHCLDVLKQGEAKLGLHQKVFGSSESKKATNLDRMKSMLDLVRHGSAWRENPDTLRQGLAQLNDPRCSKVRANPTFTKELKPAALLSFRYSKGFGAFLQAGFKCSSDIAANESLTLRLEGLTEASVPYEKVVDWTEGEDAWLPNVDWKPLKWSTKPRSVNSIWIVTSVLYATKLTVEGQKRAFAEFSANVPIKGVPGVSSVGGGLNAYTNQDNELMVKAPRNQQFIVGYRAIRLDYNHDGTLLKDVDLKSSGFRGDIDDSAQKHLKRMEEELFVVDEDGLVATIPLLTPSEAELNNLEAVDSQNV